MGDPSVTPGTFPGPTGVPGVPGAAGQLTKEQMLKLLGQMLTKTGGAMGGEAVQGQNQNNPTALQVGQVGGGAPVPNIPFNTTGAQRQIAPPSGQRPEAMQVPMPQNLGNEFATKGGAVNAAVKEGIGGLVSLLNNYKQKKQSDESIKAEGYFNQLIAASQNPSDPNNQKIIQVLGSDPKVMKMIEKGLDYTFAKEPGGPQEPEPPESHGLKSAIQKLIGKQTEQQKQAMNRPLPMPGQPGGIILPGPTQDSQIRAQSQSGQLDAARQSPEVRQQMSGLVPSATAQATLSTQERIQAGHDLAKQIVALEKAKSEVTKADAAYQSQMLANKGRFDEGTAVARINAQARATAAQIAAQASLARTLGKAPKMPSVSTQNEFQSLNRAKGLLDMIMNGDQDKGIYNQFLGALKGAGKTGASIMTSVPGQGSTMDKVGAAIDNTFNANESTKKWNTVRTGLESSIGEFSKAMKTAFPDWEPTGGAQKAAEGSQSNPIVIGGEDDKEDDDESDEITVDEDEVK